MPFSPQAPTVGVSFFVVVLCVLCAFVVKFRPLLPYFIVHIVPFGYRSSLIVPLSRPCMRDAWFLLAIRSPHASMARAAAPMWGTDVGHFQGSTPLPSLLPASRTACKLKAMSANVGLFIANFPPLPSGTPPKTLPMWGNVGESRREI